MQICTTCVCVVLMSTLRILTEMKYITAFGNKSTFIPDDEIIYSKRLLSGYTSRT